MQLQCLTCYHKSLNSLRISQESDYKLKLLRSQEHIQACRGFNFFDPFNRQSFRRNHLNLQFHCETSKYFADAAQAQHSPCKFCLKLVPKMLTSFDFQNRTEGPKVHCFHADISAIHLRIPNHYTIGLYLQSYSSLSGSTRIN